MKTLLSEFFDYCCIQFHSSPSSSDPFRPVCCCVALECQPSLLFPRVCLLLLSCQPLPSCFNPCRAPAGSELIVHEGRDFPEVLCTGLAQLPVTEVQGKTPTDSSEKELNDEHAWKISPLLASSKDKAHGRTALTRTCLNWERPSSHCSSPGLPLIRLCLKLVGV